jgi:uncharacterized protein (TIRG00374 family)
VRLRTRLLIFAAGVAVFGFFIWHVGPGALLADMRRAGWAVVPMILVWVPVLLLWNLSWWLTMSGEADRPPYWRTLVVGMAGHSINDITPFAQVGGEPFRVLAMSPWLGATGAAGSVVTYYMIHAITNMAMWVTGILVVVLFFHPPAVLWLPLAVILVLSAAAMVLLYARHQRGIVVPVVDLLGRVPLVRALVRPLAAKRAQLELVDQRVTGFYHRSPSGFWLACGADFLGRIIATGEYWFVGRALGIAMSPLQALAIGGFGALATNLVFFMPLQAGTKEGGLYFAFQLMGLEGPLGVFAAVLQRIRELAYVAIGLGLVLLAGDRETLRRSRTQT